MEYRLDMTDTLRIARPLGPSGPMYNLPRTLFLAYNLYLLIFWPVFIIFLVFCFLTAQYLLVAIFLGLGGFFGQIFIASRGIRVTGFPVSHKRHERNTLSSFLDAGAFVVFPTFPLFVILMKLQSVQLIEPIFVPIGTEIELFFIDMPIWGFSTLWLLFRYGPTLIKKIPIIMKPWFPIALIIVIAVMKWVINYMISALGR